MARYNIKIEKIKCISPGSAGKYLDTLTMIFYGHPTWVEGEEGKTKYFKKYGPDQSKYAVLGSRGRRMDITFGPGIIYEVKRTNFSSGTDIDWEFDVNIKDNEYQYSIGLVLINDRHVSDPYQFVKVLTMIAFTAGTGAGSAFLSSDSSNLSKAIVGIFKSLITGAFKETLGLIFGKWPDCSSPVFELDLTLNKKALNNFSNEKNIWHTSDDVDLRRGKCRTPNYEVEFSARLIPDYKFPINPKIKNRKYKIIKAFAGEKWIDTWANGNNPSITVNIKRSKLEPSAFIVTINEKVPNKNSFRVLFESQIFDPIKEEKKKFILYDGKETLPKFKISLAEIIDLNAKARDVFKVGGGFRLGDISKQKPKEPKKTLDLTMNEAVFFDKAIKDLAIKPVYGNLLLEEGATILIPQLALTLTLYEVTEILDNSEIRDSGIMMRYVRMDQPSATKADLKLFKFSQVN